jgi:hypothetical protein
MVAASRRSLDARLKPRSTQKQRQNATAGISLVSPNLCGFVSSELQRKTNDGNDNSDDNGKCEIQGSLHCGGFAAFGRDDVWWVGRKGKAEADPYGMTNKNDNGNCNDNDNAVHDWFVYSTPIFAQ